MPEVAKRLDKIEKQINELIRLAEENRRRDPDNAMMKARKACETICREVCLKEGLIKEDKDPDGLPLDIMIGRITKNKKAPRNICTDMRTIQWKGNDAVHFQESTSAMGNPAAPALEALSNVTRWYFDKYGSSGPQTNFPDPDEPIIKKKGKPLLKNSTFQKLAVGAMTGTAVAIGAKLLQGKKDS
jgi:hypothetical protein